MIAPGEMAQLVKCLPRKHGVLKLGPQHSHKSQAWQNMPVTSVLWGRGRLITGVHCQLAELMSFRFSELLLSQKNKKRITEDV